MSPPCYATKKLLIGLIVGAILLLIVKCHSGSPWSVAMIISITIVMIMIIMMIIFIIINISVSRPPPPA